MAKEERFMPNGDGIKLKTIRKKMGLTVAEFSAKTSINPSFVNLLEKGCLPLSKRDKGKIGEAFGLEENWFEQMEINIRIEDVVTSNVNESIGCNEIDINTPTLKEPKDCRALMFINNGESLRTTRLALGMSRKEIANAIGITSVQIGYIETGKRALTDKIMSKLNSYVTSNPKNLHSIFRDTHEKVSNTFAEQFAEKSNDNVENNDILIKLRMIKKECGYTQSEVSIMSGVNRSQLSMIENGKMQISKKVKVKLLNFISFELEGIKKKSERILSTSAIATPADDYVPSLHQNANKVILANATNNKTELQKAIQSMKRTRDELQNNINMLEQALNNMSV